MPSLNLRLTDELHAALVAAAALSGRSLQREIVMRLDGRVPVVGSGEAVRSPISSEVGPPGRAVSLEPTVDRSFRPDFKKGVSK